MKLLQAVAEHHAAREQELTAYKAKKAEDQAKYEAGAKRAMMTLLTVLDCVNPGIEIGIIPGSQDPCQLKAFYTLEIMMPRRVLVALRCAKVPRGMFWSQHMKVPMAVIPRR